MLACFIDKQSTELRSSTKVFEAIVLDSRRKRKILHTSTHKKNENTERYVREDGKRTYHCSDAGNETRHFNDAENETRKATRQNKS